MELPCHREIVCARSGSFFQGFHGGALQQRWRISNVAGQNSAKVLRVSMTMNEACNLGMGCFWVGSGKQESGKKGTVVHTLLFCKEP